MFMKKWWEGMVKDEGFNFLELNFKTVSSHIWFENEQKFYGFKENQFGFVMNNNILELDFNFLALYVRHVEEHVVICSACFMAL